MASQKDKIKQFITENPNDPRAIEIQRRIDNGTLKLDGRGTLRQFASGVGKSALGLVRGTFEASEKVGRFGTGTRDEFAGQPTLAERFISEKAVTPQTRAEKAGFITGDIAQFALPGGQVVKGSKALSALAKGGIKGTILRSAAESAAFGGIGSLQKGEVAPGVFVTSAIFPVAGKVVSKLGKGTSTFLFGPEGTAGLVARYKDPKGVQKFITTARRKPGGTEVSDISEILTNKVSEYKDFAVKRLTDAEDLIVNTPIPKVLAKDRLLTTIKDFLDEPKLTDSAIKASGVSDQSANKIIKVLRNIRAGEIDNTRGALALKRKISNQFGGTQNTKESDALVTKLTNQLNKEIEKVDPTFRQALKDFSKDKDFLDKLGVNVVGKSKLNVDQTSDKLVQLAKDLDNPFKREGAEKLLNELGAKTNFDFIGILRALKTAMKLSPQQAQGLRAGVVREIVRMLEVGVSEVAGVSGRLRQSFLGGSIPEGTGRAAIFQLLKLMD